MVYIVTDGSGFCKIGVAKNLKNRLKGIQTGNPREIRVLKTITNESVSDYWIEHELHEHYKEARVTTANGQTEWFDMSKCRGIEFLTTSQARNILYDLRPVRLCVSSYSFTGNKHKVEELRDYLSSKTYQIICDEGFNSVESVKEHFENSPWTMQRVGSRRENEIKYAINQFYKDLELEEVASGRSELCQLTEQKRM